MTDVPELDELCARARAAVDAGDVDSGVALLEHAAAEHPRHAGLRMELGQALIEARLHKFALIQFDIAIALDSGLADAHIQRGRALLHLKEWDAAARDFHRAIGLDRRNADAHACLGALCSVRGDFEQAMRSLDAAISLDPGHLRAHMDRASLLLSQGRFEEGWADYAWRVLKVPGTGGAATWSGDRSRRLLLCKEQGPGEQILFASLLRELAGFTHRVSVTVDDRLLPLFERSIPGFRFLPKNTPVGQGEYEELVPLGALGREFRQTLADFERAPVAYLHCDRERRDAISSRIRRPGRRICGLSWRSRSFRLGDNKSIALEDLAPLLGREEFDFFDLQYGDTQEERTLLQDRHALTLHKLADIDNTTNFDALAALIMACDVVVTTSNTTAHLAGALGQRTLLLAPRGVQTIWYWSAIDGRSLWYPNVRVFVQSRAGDWRPCVEQARTALMRLE